MEARFRQYVETCEGLVWQSDQALADLFNEYAAVVKDVGLTSDILVQTFVTMQQICLARKGLKGYELEVGFLSF